MYNQYIYIINKTKTQHIITITHMNKHNHINNNETHIVISHNNKSQFNQTQRNTTQTHNTKSNITNTEIILN